MPASAPVDEESAPVLDPIDRNAEILFGLYMCLTFTGTISVATAGHEEVRSMMIAAIACNTAWGLVDGAMYLLRGLVARGRRLHLARAVRNTADPAAARAIIASDLGSLYLRAIGEDGLERIRAELVALPDVPARPSVTWADIRAAILIFALVFTSTLPLVLPFAFFDHMLPAKRVSAAIAIAIMFYCGYSWGRHIGGPPVRTGFKMVFIGMLIEATIFALGG